MLSLIDVIDTLLDFEILSVLFKGLPQRGDKVVSRSFAYLYIRGKIAIRAQTCRLIHQWPKSWPSKTET